MGCRGGHAIVKVKTAAELALGWTGESPDPTWAEEVRAFVSTRAGVVPDDIGPSW